MEIWQVRYFLAVAEALNFRRAAEALNVSQPPLSRAIANLEKELGVALFLRANRRVSLTPAGDAFRREAVALLRQAEHAVEVAQGSNADRLKLSIGFEGSSVYDIVPRAVQAFRARFADADITLSEMPTAHQAQALRAGELDVGFVVLPLHDKTLAITEVWREPLVVAVPSGHRLATRNSVDLSELRDEAFVTSSRKRACGMQDGILALARVAGFAPNIVLDVNETQLQMGFVAAGAGIAVVPECLGTQARGGVVSIALQPRTTAALGLARPRSSRSEAAQTFADIVKGLAATPA